MLIASYVLNFNLKQTIDLLSAAWNEVSVSTIANCWHYAGFSKQNSGDKIEEITDSRTLPFETIFENPKEYIHIPSEVIPSVYVSLDDDLPTDDIKYNGQYQ